MEEMKSSGRTDLRPLAAMSMKASRMDDSGIEQTISRLWRDYQYIADPHTACAFTDMAADRASVVLATASPAKFPDVVARATGTEPTHPALEALKSLPVQTWPLPANVGAVKEFIRSHIA